MSISDVRSLRDWHMPHRSLSDNHTNSWLHYLQRVIVWPLWNGQRDNVAQCHKQNIVCFCCVWQRQLYSISWNSFHIMHYAPNCVAQCVPWPIHSLRWIEDVSSRSICCVEELTLMRLEHRWHRNLCFSRFCGIAFLCFIQTYCTIPIQPSTLPRQPLFHLDFYQFQLSCYGD